MKMTKLNQFFRDAGAAIRSSPEVKQALKQAERKLAQDLGRQAQRFADGFEARRSKPAMPTPPSASAAADAEFVKGLYRDLLGREPDAGGMQSHLNGLATGMSREEIRQVFLSSSEYREKQAAPPVTEPTEPSVPTSPATPTPPAGPTLVEPGEPLRTVPLRPEYAEANIDKSSPTAAALSAARWARVKYADLFTRAEDRNVCAEIMTHVIGALRVAGYDATRVVNHPSMPDGARWGSDAVVINGDVYDVYRAMGEASEPVAQNMGRYAAGRLRE